MTPAQGGRTMRAAQLDKVLGTLARRG